jgi:hypothetical protein
MLRALLYGLTLLHLGPGIAFALLAFGCDPIDPALSPAVCGDGGLGPFLKITVIAWAVLGAALGLWLVATRAGRFPGRLADRSADGPATGSADGPMR